MVFGDIVTHVMFSRAPINMKLLLGDAIFYPIESHVYRFGMFHFHSVQEETYSRLVVNFYRSEGLGVV